MPRPSFILAVFSSRNLPVSQDLRCFRCGESLASLTPPLSRHDMCPACSVFLHVCRMCRHFDETVATQCREEDAEEVTDKEKQNFCDWFEPDAGAFDGSRKQASDKAQADLAALFGDAPADDEPKDPDLQAAEDLFK